MDFSSITWWGYAIVVAIGVGFGILQSVMMRGAMLGDKPRKWLYAVKLLLWAVALVVMAIISLPLLVVFVAVASLTLLIGTAIVYRKAQREAR